MKLTLPIQRIFYTFELAIQKPLKMNKNLLFLLSFCLFSSALFSQKIISGQSNATSIRLNPEYERGLPPNLYVSLSFEDENNNGILEPNETALLKLTISNKGKGAAQGLEVFVEDNISDQNLIINDGKKIPYIYPNKSVNVDIPMKAGFNIASAEHKLKIRVREHFGYDMDDAFLVLNTLEYLAPELVFSGLEIIDIGEGTGAIIEDGQLQPGEQVKVKVMVQNIGENISINTAYKVSSTNNNIYVMNVSGNLGDIAVGEVKELWITISPNKRVSKSGELPIYLTVTNKHSVGGISYKQLPITLNQKPPAPSIVEVKVNIDRLQKQVARFEYTSNKITANISNIIDIRQIQPSKTKRPNAIAVVIGVEDYKNFVAAPYAANDAEIMKDYFGDVLGIEKVFTYTNKEVSGFFFADIFNPNYGELQKAIIKGETELFVFYSGHGMPSKDGENVYLFPYDGRKEALSRQGYNINTFYQNLNALGAKTTTVFIDACFSGVSRASEELEMHNLMAMKGVTIKPKVEQPWDSNTDFSVFTSSSFNETSLGFDASKTGLFTYFVCAGLQGNADANRDNEITNGELRDYVIEKVRETSVKITGKQTPLFYGNQNYILSEY